jgi:hypothetical protein
VILPFEKGQSVHLHHLKEKHFPPARKEKNFHTSIKKTPAENRVPQHHDHPKAPRSPIFMAERWTRVLFGVENQNDRIIVVRMRASQRASGMHKQQPHPDIDANRTCDSYITTSRNARASYKDMPIVSRSEWLPE